MEDLCELHIILGDEEFLEGKDIKNLKKEPIVFFNSCSGAFVGRLLGNTNLASSFISNGALIYISPLLTINDYLASLIAVDFYSALRELPVGDSLNTAIRTTLFQLDYSDYTIVTYVIFGDPTLVTSQIDFSGMEGAYYMRIGEEAANYLDIELSIKAYKIAAIFYKRNAENFWNKSLVTLSEEERQYHLIEFKNSIAYSLRCESLAYHNLATKASLKNAWNIETIETIYSAMEQSTTFLSKASELARNPYNRLKWTSEFITQKGKCYYLKALIEYENRNFAAAMELFNKASVQFQNALPLVSKVGVKIHFQSQVARVLDSMAWFNWMDFKLSNNIRKRETARTLFKEALRIVPPQPISFEGNLFRSNLKRFEIESRLKKKQGRANAI